MADAIEKAARQVRILGRDVHQLTSAITDPIVCRRRYKTRCNRYLYNDEGAALTTRKVTCRECNSTTVFKRVSAARRELQDAGVLAGAAP